MRSCEPAVVTGGWETRGYKQVRELAPALGRGDDTEGYASLLSLTFDGPATDLPGVFGSARVADLIPVPAATLRYAVEADGALAGLEAWRAEREAGPEKWRRRAHRTDAAPHQRRSASRFHPKGSFGNVIGSVYFEPGEERDDRRADPCAIDHVPSARA